MKSGGMTTSRWPIYARSEIIGMQKNGGCWNSSRIQLAISCAIIRDGIVKRRPHRAENPNGQAGWVTNGNRPASVSTVMCGYLRMGENQLRCTMRSWSAAFSQSSSGHLNAPTDVRVFGCRVVGMRMLDSAASVIRTHFVRHAVMWPRFWSLDRWRLLFGMRATGCVHIHREQQLR